MKNRSSKKLHKKDLGTIIISKLRLGANNKIVTNSVCEQLKTFRIHRDGWQSYLAFCYNSDERVLRVPSRNQLFIFLKSTQL